MELSEMDLVYTLGTYHGSQWENNEIRYSLRSIEKNMPHRNIVIVGYCPEFLQNVIHIPVRDGAKHKSLNTLIKMKIACLSHKISQDFVLMNDDFYVLNPITELPDYYKSTLNTRLQHEKERGSQGSRYYYTIKRTAELFDRPKDFDMHIPMKFNKKKFLDLFRNFDMHRIYLYRSVYGNFYDLKGERIDRDVKIFGVNDFYKQTGLTFMSLSPDAALKPAIQHFLEEMFPKLSKYERY